MIGDGELFRRLRALLRRGWVDIPGGPGYGGTGAPGKLLEELLGVDGANLDIPDAGRWEIKYHSSNSALTLFHKEARPPGHMRHLVREFGWPDEQGRTSFRHTIWGRSDRGFRVVGERDRITVRNDAAGDMIWPWWTHDDLLNAFVSKFRRLIVVRGLRRGDRVRYERADRFEEPQATLFVEAVTRGIVAIDFDARTTRGRGLRNHGTKFRIRYGDLRHLYHRHEAL